MFTSLSETVKVNFIPIAIVLALVLLIVGYLIYRSMSVSSKIEEENFEPGTEQSDYKSNDEHAEEDTNQTEHNDENDDTSPE